jgi:hypothetical protein
MTKLLTPIVEERIRLLEHLGAQWLDKPVRANIYFPVFLSTNFLTFDQDDYLMWLIEAAPEEKRKPADFSDKILHINFTAIHSTSTVCR